MRSFLIIVVFGFYGCGHSAKPGNETSQGAISRQSPIVVRILPLGAVKPAVLTDLISKINTMVPGTVLLKTEPLPASAWYKPRNRYRADSIIHWLSGRAAANEVYLGITSADVSTTKGDIPDYGVMGLGYQPGKACLASSFRLKDKSSFWKVAIHELGHTTGLPHCPVKSCFMRDAEGGNPTAEEISFCNNCTLHLKNKGWTL